MRISGEGTLSLALGLAALVGAGVVVVGHGPIVVIAGWSLIAAGVVGGILLAHHHFQRRRMIPLIGMIASSLGFIGFAAWYFWPVGSVATPATQGAGLKTHQPNPLDDTILIECSTRALPSVVPPDGTYWVLQIQPNPAASAHGGIGQMTGVPGSKLDWPNWGPIDTLRCQITNYGPTPVFNARFAVNLTYLEAVKDSSDPNSAHSGSAKASVPFPMDVTRIDVGAGQAFVFWVANLSRDFVRIDLPEHIAFVPLGTDKPTIAKLIAPNRAWLFVNPIRETATSTLSATPPVRPPEPRANHDNVSPAGRNADESVHVGKDNFGNACSGQAPCEQESQPVVPGSQPHS